MGIPETGLFNLGYAAYAARWSNPIYVRSVAVTRGLDRAKAQWFGAFEAGADENTLHGLQNKIARYEHAKRRIEMPLHIVAALADEPSRMTRMIVRALAGEAAHV